MRGGLLFWVSYGALWVILLLQTAVLLEVVRRLAKTPGLPSVQRGADPLETGTKAPKFTAPVLGDGTFLDSDTLLGRQFLVHFVSPTCPTCEETLGVTLDIGERLGAELLAVCRGERASCEDFVRRHLPGTVSVWDEGDEIARRFQVHSSPLSVLVDEEWRIVKYGRPLTGDEKEAMAVVEDGGDEEEERPFEEEVLAVRGGAGDGR